jgi:hypothetical protein
VLLSAPAAGGASAPDESAASRKGMGLT